jgi:hypothetical protein
MGTCPTVCLEEMGEQSGYQKEMDWMRCPEKNWPMKKAVTPAPAEECRKGMVLAIPGVALTAEVAMV